MADSKDKSVFAHLLDERDKNIKAQDDLAASTLDSVESFVSDSYDQQRAAIPEWDDFGRVKHDIEVGILKGVYGGVKSLATGVIDLLRFSTGQLPSESYVKAWNLVTSLAKEAYISKFGTAAEIQDQNDRVIAFAKKAYGSIKKDFEDDWDKAGKPPGKRTELVSKWVSRGVFEIAALFVGAGEAKAALKGAEAVGEGAKLAEALSETGRVLDGVATTCNAAERAQGAARLTEAGVDAVKAGEAVADAGKAGKAGDAAADAGKAARTGGAATDASKAHGKTPTEKPTPRTEECSLSGCPISMVTGEELLSCEDFNWDGPLALTWIRFYRSSHSEVDLQLGHGWLTPLDEWLEVRDGGVIYHDSEGRSIPLPLPTVGNKSVNLPEQLRLYNEGGRFRLQAENAADRIFAGTRGRCQLTRWQNELGHHIDLIYDQRGQVEALSSSWGKALSIQRDGHRILSITPARRSHRGLEPVAQPLVRYRFDHQGDLAAALDRLDQGERYTYINHVISCRTLATGFNFHFKWDSYSPTGRCVRNWGDNGILDYRFEWAEAGISRVTDSRGGVREYLHDVNGLLQRETSPEGYTTLYGYDDNNVRTSITDALGHTTRFTYDGDGRLTSVTDALGQAARFAYDETGNPITLIDAAHQTWTRKFDEQGRLVQAEDPQGGATRYAYNAQGLLATIIDAVGQRRTLLWDEEARLVGAIDFDGMRQSYQYDAEDRIVAAITQDKLVTRYQYDALGRIVAVKHPDERVVRLRYNAAGLLTHYIDAAGRTTEYRYDDGLSQITERIDPGGHSLRYHYDSERNLIGLTNAKGERYQLIYDKDENLIAEIGFDGREQRYQYSAAGYLQAYAQRGDPQLGQPRWLLTMFQRDPLGKLLKKTAADGAVSEFGYDPLGRLISARNAYSTLSFIFNPLDQVVQEIQSDAVVLNEYDALGRRTATVTPDQHRLEYRYGEQGRLQEITFDEQSLSKHRFDEFGREVARQQGTLLSRYEYDPMGRLLRHQVDLASRPQAILVRSYGYDPSGNITAIDDFRQGKTRYIYDPSERLIEVEGVTPERFVHDPAGNLIGVNRDSGGLVKGDRLIMLGDRHFTYDAAGNLIQERRGKEGRMVTRYTYDGESRLIHAVTPDSEARYYYDPLGRRITKQIPEGETRFVYDGVRLLAESQNEIRRTYVFEPGGFCPLARIDNATTSGATAFYFYQLDHLGTPREMTDMRGQIVWSARYRAYGALAEADVAQVDNFLRFQGQYLDSETGLHYNLNRYYDPESGRFIGQDPAGLAGGVNLYEYGRNPTNWIDPWGLVAAPPDLPEKAGVYIITNGNRSYVGSSGLGIVEKGSQGMNKRVSTASHEKAQELLKLEGTKVEYIAVDLGSATSRSDRNNILRYFEQREYVKQRQLGYRVMNSKDAPPQAADKMEYAEELIRRHKVTASSRIACKRA